MSGLEDRILILIKDLEEEKRLADKRAKQLYLAGAGVVSFIGHDDTPAAYAGQAGKFVKVNATPNALIFAAIAWADVLKAGSNLTDLATRQHAGLTDVTANQHHAQSHTLASHSTKPHSALTDVTSDQHHAISHEARHRLGGADPLNHDNLAGFVFGEHFLQSAITTVGTIGTGVWQGTAIGWTYVSKTGSNLTDLATRQHAGLTNILPDQHHTEDHTLASHTTRPHSALSDAPADAHHPQSHTLASHSAKAHGDLTDIGVNDHHTQSHTLVSHTARDHHNLTGLADDDHSQYYNAARHTKALHDGLGLSHDSLVDVSVNDHHAQIHAASHLSGAGDAIKLDDLAAPDDNTDLDFSTTKHGLVPKGLDAGSFLKDDGTWDVPPGGGNVVAAANLTDNAIVRGDGGVKGVQTTGCFIDDNDNLNVIGQGGFRETTGTAGLTLFGQSPWNSVIFANAKYDGANEVYVDTSGRGAFKILFQHDRDTSAQYIAFYGANEGAAGATISWNTVGLTMDEDGNVGMGTTTPSVIASWTADVDDTILSVLSSTRYGRIAAQGNLGAMFDLVDTGGGANDKWLSLRVGDGIAKFRTLKDDGSAIQTENILVMDLGVGSIGMGTATPTRTYGTDPFLEIQGATNPALILHDTGQASDYGLIAAGDFIAFYFGNTRLVSFDNSGNLNIISATSTITGGTRLSLEAGASGICSDTIYGDTTATAANMYIWSTFAQMMRSTSSQRYKDKVVDIDLDSSLIHNLRPVSFISKSKADAGKKFVGLIAEDIEQYYPEIMIYNKKNEVEDYDTKMLMTLILAETQRHEARIAALEAQLNN